jgi:hypothetical protein
MSVTLKDIKATFYQYQSHEQIDSKQLFICRDIHPEGAPPAKYPHILIAYRTIVGRYNSETGCWELTKKKYSVTTTKQLNQFARNHNVIWVDSL